MILRSDAKRSDRRASSGFTLIEVVLAIALASVVMYLLTTAIELYLVRVDSSRTRVESAQVARAVLDKIASDLKSARFLRPPAAATGSGSSLSGTGGSGDGTGGGSGSGGGGVGNSGGNSSGGSGASGGSSGTTSSTAMQLLGVSGDETELRIDRISYPDWDRPMLPEQSLLEAADDATAATARYFLQDGQRQTSQRIAQLGVQAEPNTGMAGLYREQLPTALLLEETSSSSYSGYASYSGSAGASGRLSDESDLQLLAPEVVELTFAYFDGETMVDQWDLQTEGAMPLGIEIRIKVLEMSYEEALERDKRGNDLTQVGKDDVIEYRRFVQIPTLRRRNRTPQQLMLPGQNQSPGGGRGGQGGGQGEQSGGQSGGAPGQGGGNGA